MISDIVALIVAFGVGDLGARLVDAVLGIHLYPLMSSNALHEFAAYGLIGGVSLFWLDTKGHYVQRLPFWEVLSHIITIVFVGFLISGFTQFLFKKR